MSTATWVDCNSTPGYLGGWSADMGVYKGPWPFYWPPTISPDGYRQSRVDFTVMLPNPSVPTSVGLAGDGTYDTYVYGTSIIDPGGLSATSWWTDGEGAFNDAPLPPTQQPGAHLYVSVYNSAGVTPSITPASLVPGTYGGTNTQEWTGGEWSSVQPASDQHRNRNEDPGLGTFQNPRNSHFGRGVVGANQSGTGYSNNAIWASFFSAGYYNVAPTPFTPQNLGALESSAKSKLLVSYPSRSVNDNAGMIAVHGEKHIYNPGDGTGIVAEDPPVIGMQLGQVHHSTHHQIRNTDRPPFFNTGFDTTWASKPWDDDSPDWDPSGTPTLTFDHQTVELTTAGVGSYENAIPTTTTTTQTFNVYAREIVYPWTGAETPSDDRGGSVTDGSILNARGLRQIGTFTISVDVANNTGVGSPSVDLDLSSVPLTGDGTGHWGIMVILEPEAWQSDTGLVFDLPEPPVPGNNVDIGYHYDYACDGYLYVPGELNYFDWTVHWPPFRYWVPGRRIPSVVSRGIGNGKYAPRVVAFVP